MFGHRNSYRGLEWFPYHHLWPVGPLGELISGSKKYFVHLRNQKQIIFWNSFGTDANLESVGGKGLQPTWGPQQEYQRPCPPSLVIPHPPPCSPLRFKLFEGWGDEGRTRSAPHPNETSRRWEWECTVLWCFCWHSGGVRIRFPVRFQAVNVPGFRWLPTWEPN